LAGAGMQEFLTSGQNLLKSFERESYFFLIIIKYLYICTVNYFTGMIRKSVLRKLILIPMLTSVFMLCTGSLINFHQYRIWHKPLMPELVAYKRDNEKAPAQINPHQHAFSAPCDLIPWLAGISTASHAVLLPSSHFTYSSFCRCAPPDRIITDHGLRAPPVA
jgi:hypothetical protein